MKATKYIALLRGINVGGNNTVSMAKLKKEFESLGFTDVITYINSGNIVFSAQPQAHIKMVTMIETMLHKKCGFEIRVVIRDAQSIMKLVKAIPAAWKNDATEKTDVLFLWDEFDNKKSLALLPINPDVDTLKYISGAIVWHLNKKHYAKSGMHKFIGTKVYKHMTARNINTVRKLAELMK